MGFATLYAHRIVPIDRCPILAPGLAGLIDAAWAIAETLKPAAKPLDIQATATDHGIDVDVRGSGPLTAPLTLALARVAETHRLARITRHGELVAQRTAPQVRIGKVEALGHWLPSRFRISARMAAPTSLVEAACSSPTKS